MEEIVKYSVKTKDIPRNELDSFLYQVVAEAFISTGFKSDKMQVMAIIDILSKDIQTRFKLLELPEIKTAVANGVRFVYGEYAGISVATINKWLQCYVNSGEHSAYLEAKVKTLAPLLTEQSSKTTEEIDRIMTIGIISCFEKYKITGVAYDYGSPKADWLRKKGILTPSEDERNELKAFAHERLLEDAEGRKMSYSRNERNDAKRQVDRLLKNGDHDAEVIALAKNIMLVQWFEKLIEENADIKELLK